MIGHVGYDTRQTQTGTIIHHETSHLHPRLEAVPGVQSRYADPYTLPVGSCGEGCDAQTHVEFLPLGKEISAHQTPQAAGWHVALAGPSQLLGLPGTRPSSPI